MQGEEGLRNFTQKNCSFQICKHVEEEKMCIEEILSMYSYNNKTLDRGRRF